MPGRIPRSKKERRANFEALRILAMLMIVSLHYLDKGGVLPKADAVLTTKGYIAWLIEAFCVPSVNLYVLISAIFLVDLDYKPERVIRLWGEVFFYSVIIPIVFLVKGAFDVGFGSTNPVLITFNQAGAGGLSSFFGMFGLPTDVYTWLHYIFPITQEHYWYITAYVIMVLMAPLMNKGIKSLTKREFETGLLILLTLLCFANTILPVKLPLDRGGYDVLWFLCLYMVGAYLRLYVLKREDYGDVNGNASVDQKKSENLKDSENLKGIGNLKVINAKTIKYLALFIVSCLVIYFSLVALNMFFHNTGALAGFINRQYQYNSAFNLLASVFLVIAFDHISVPEGSKAAGFILKASSASLSVYLIHEHELLRYTWPKLLKVREAWDTAYFIPHWLGCIILIYAVCMGIDLIRQKFIQ